MRVASAGLQPCGSQSVLSTSGLGRRSQQPLQQRGRAPIDLGLAGRRSTRAMAVATTGFPYDQEDAGPQDPPTKKLNEPVMLDATGRTRLSVVDAGGAGALQTYMTLPVEQYTLLEGVNTERLGGDLFRITIPRMKFFSVWIEPMVEVTVRITPDEVRVVSGRTSVSGSKFVEKTKMNEKFDMYWDTRLNWGKEGDEAWMQAATNVRVWCEVLPPFHMMPRSVLSGTCNAVLRQIVPRLLTVFLQNLRTDYERWAADPEYRLQRAQQGDIFAQAAAAAKGKAASAAHSSLGGEDGSSSSTTPAS